MTHIVKSGESLSKIAKAYGLTLAQLLDANPRFKPNPNRVHVGAVLTVPDRQQGPAAEPSPVQPHPAAGRVLGKLSERYETGGRGPGTVSTGQGDAGGVSYGSYQMTSKPGGGTVGRFVVWSAFPFRSKFEGLTPGSGGFTAAWKALAQTHPEAFHHSQHAYIKGTHFDPLVQKILDEDRVNVLTRSHALQDVIWSTAVQHGRNNGIVHRALDALDARPADPDFDERLIRAIYAERGRRNANGVLVYFSRNAPAVQRGVANRFKAELKDALRKLAEEATAPAGPAPQESVTEEAAPTSTTLIRFGPHADATVVSAHSRRVLTDLLRAAGIPSCLITSTSRTPADQARIMYTNITNHGVAKQKALYAASGDAVIDEYVRAKQAGQSRAQIIAAMEAKIRALGPERVSRHCSDPVKLNVIDIAPSSIEDAKEKAFAKAVEAAQAAGAVGKFFSPGSNDPAFHLEIPQP